MMIWFGSTMIPQSLPPSEAGLLEGDWIMGLLCSSVDESTTSSELKVLSGDGAWLERVTVSDLDGSVSLSGSSLLSLP